MCARAFTEAIRTGHVSVDGNPPCSAACGIRHSAAGASLACLFLAVSKRRARRRRRTRRARTTSQLTRRAGCRRPGALWPLLPVVIRAAGQAVHALRPLQVQHMERMTYEPDECCPPASDPKHRMAVVALDARLARSILSCVVVGVGCSLRQSVVLHIGSSDFGATCGALHSSRRFDLRRFGGSEHLDPRPSGGPGAPQRRTRRSLLRSADVAHLLMPCA